jgi:hypothetical protein
VLHAASCSFRLVAEPTNYMLQDSKQHFSVLYMQTFHAKAAGAARGPDM